MSTEPPYQEGNDVGLSADQAVADMRADRGDLPGAQRQLQALVDNAPMNADLLQDLAGVRIRQGHVREGQALLTRAHTLDPWYPPTRAAASGAAWQRHDAAGARAQWAPLVCRYPRSPTVQRMVEEDQRNRGWQVDVTVRRDQGQSPDWGSRSVEGEGSLWSPLWDDHWRAGLVARWAWADVPEGKVNRDRIGPAVRYETQDWVVYGQVLANANGQVGRPSWEAGVSWAPLDAWSFGLDGSTASADTPLRADAYGIYAKALNLSAAYQPSDRTTVRVRYGQSWFSDGNHRQALTVSGEQRVWTGADWSLDATGEASASQNSKPYQPYYDPRNDAALLGGVTFRQLFHAAALSRAEQNLSVQVGPYQEAHYGTSWLATVAYGQTYTWRPGRSWGWQLGWRSQAYDGQRDHAWWASVTFHGGS